jgi:5'-deoxynucleotidase YfbR-like HD superfamily hydrolase
MNYYEDIYRLAQVKRYSNVPKIHEESVAEHGFFVAAIVMKLHEEYEFNLGLALQIAISHDMTEMELNDCPHIIKRKYPEIAAAYEKCEKDVENILPKQIGFASQRFRLQKCVESKIVALADVIQCSQYSAVELKLGNDGYMKDVFEGSLIRETRLRKELSQYERV